MSKCYLLFAEGLEECEGLITLDILRRAGLETYTVSVEDAHTVVGAHGAAAPGRPAGRPALIPASRRWNRGSR